MTAIAKNRDGPRVESSSHRVAIFHDSLWDVTFDRADPSPSASAYYPTLPECFKSVSFSKKKKRKKSIRIIRRENGQFELN